MKLRIASTSLICGALLSSCTTTFAENKISPSGVTGVVSLSPGCPGPQIKDQPCFRPFAGKEVQLLDQAGKVVGQAITDGNGRFAIDVAAEKYALKVNVGAMYPRCPVVEVLVKDQVKVEANIVCDSGMR